ncbi:hypothetical protein ACVIJ6_004414 [Bradyrhizobium sp. USDA 4369]
MFEQRARAFGPDRIASGGRRSQFRKFRQRHHAGDLPDMSNLIEMRSPCFAVSIPPREVLRDQTKSPLPISRRGLYDFFDSGKMRLICPTCQAQWPTAISSTACAPIG